MEAEEGRERETSPAMMIGRVRGQDRGWGEPDGEAMECAGGERSEGGRGDGWESRCEGGVDSIVGASGD